ncbi:hypothetical protein KEM56_006085, partial [Ascosphaera pollenicola]
ICGLRGEKIEKEEPKDEKTETSPASHAGTSSQGQGSEPKGTGEADVIEESETANDKSNEPSHPVRCEVVEEGAEGSGVEQRECLGIPAAPDQRKKFYLNEANREALMFEAGRLYKADFGNSYISFSDFSLRLPGFKVVVTDYIDEKHHELRYVLKNKKTGELYFSLRFNLLYQGREGEIHEEKEEPTYPHDEKTSAGNEATENSDSKTKEDEID